MCTLASCGSCIKFHSWPTGTYLGNFDLNEENMFIRTISWSNTGSKIVAVPSKGEPMVIEAPADPKLLMGTETPGLTVTFLNISNANVATFPKTKTNNLAIGTLNGEVYVFDMNSGRIVNEYPVLPHGVQFLHYAYQDSALAAGCRNGQIILYTNKNNQNIISASFVVPNSYSLSAMNFSCGYQSLLGGASKEGTITIWDYVKGHAVFSAKQHTNIVTDLAFCTVDNVISSVGLDKKFNTFDLRSGQCVFSNILERELTSVAYAFDKDEMAVSTNDGQLLCYDKRNLTVPLCTFIAHKKSIKKIAFQTENFKLPECELKSNEKNENVDYSDYPASGDCSTIVDPARISGGMDPVNNKVHFWIDNLPASASQTNINTESATHVVKNIESLKHELLHDMKVVTDKFAEYMNQQFFKIRMEVSKYFVNIEDQTERKSRSFILALKEGNGNKEKAKKTSSAEIDQDRQSKIPTRSPSNSRYNK